MENNTYQAIEISKKITIQNENIKNAIHFLKNITHSSTISHKKRNGDIVGISKELKSEISNMIDKLEKANILGYDIHQIILDKNNTINFNDI